VSQHLLVLLEEELLGDFIEIVRLQLSLRLLARPLSFFWFPGDLFLWGVHSVDL
jgi:hypothetical protein